MYTCIWCIHVYIYTYSTVARRRLAAATYYLPTFNLYPSIDNVGTNSDGASLIPADLGLRSLKTVSCFSILCHGRPKAALTGSLRGA